MKFIADFHVHSRYSIATAKNLDFENLYIAAQLKGIDVVGTGDMTHPKWFEQAKKKLIPAEEGLYRLKDEIARECDAQIPSSCRAPVRFIITTEISNIYKKDNRTRKNHNLLFLPDFKRAAQFNKKLDKIGNIRSDGRPILGLDARNLLEIMLETSDQAFLVPAHIWTPWFSVLGSQSGFDSISECFEDLTSHIFAVETGLSSDPEMNWRVSALDGLTLISNSDAHSPMKLGREANLFDTELDYGAIRKAMETGDEDNFLGTFEFYPEEGKYHMDGHRKCRICLKPQETMSLGGICPVCDKPVTRGVLYRVEQLTDRDCGDKPEKSHPYYHMVPLTDILSEIVKVGPNSKKVQKKYRKALNLMGSEFEILHKLPEKKIEKSGIPLLAEAVKRVRQGKINISPGYDGKFGQISIFTSMEREKLMGQKSLFFFKESEPEKKIPAKKKRPREKGKKTSPTPMKKNKDKTKQRESTVNGGLEIAQGLNEEQLKAVGVSGSPLMIVAGPGSGKTLTLTHRMAHLIAAGGISAENMLALTFTNKAAEEMKNRLERLLGTKKDLPFIGTFHSLCFNLLKDSVGDDFISVIDDTQRKEMIKDAVKLVVMAGVPVSVKSSKLAAWINHAKLLMINPEKYVEQIESNEEKKIFVSVYRAYQNIMEIQGLYDYDDLIFCVVERLEKDEIYCSSFKNRFKYIFVDEYQDLNSGQYRLIKALAPDDREICVIGDPNQSIYGFRGSDVRYFSKFLEDYPQARTVRLNRNYRSTETILKASDRIIRKHDLSDSRKRIFSGIEGKKKIVIIKTPSEKSEAVAVGKIIEEMVGGSGFHAIDFDKIEACDSMGLRSFSDVAILFRTLGPIKVFSECLKKAGIPCQVASRESLFDQKGIASIVSMLKIMEGAGSFIDLQKTFNILEGGARKQTLETFKFWSYEKKINLKEALKGSRKFPIPGLKRSEQQKMVCIYEKYRRMEKNTTGLSLRKKLCYIVEQTRFLEKAENKIDAQEKLNRMISLSDEHKNDVKGFIAAMAFNTDTDVYQAVAEKVTLMTMHAAKGLEFPVVFITGCEKDNIPFRRPNRKISDIDEERRLFYVAMTRAREELYLTYVQKRRIYGKIEKRTISPFIFSLGDNLIEKNQEKKKRLKPLQLKLF